MLTAPEPFRLGYRPWLDGLRGLSIAAVLAFHLGYLPGGFLGVDVFFVSSGFLITALLMQEWRDTGAIRLGRFYLRRVLRLLPALVALMLVVAAVDAVFWPGRLGQTLRGCLVAACYLSNWQRHTGVGMPTLGHTWSLSVEEQFYLLWPPLLLLLLRSRLNRVSQCSLLVGGILASCLVRRWLYNAVPRGDAWGGEVTAIYMGLHTRADALLVGCVVGFLAVWGLLPAGRRVSRAVAFVAAGCGGWMVWMAFWNHMDNPNLYRWRFTLVAVLVAAVLVCMLTGRNRLARSLLEFGPLVWVGRLSYSLYLFHIPANAWVEDAAPGLPAALAVALKLALTVALAVACHYAVERPFLRLKDRAKTPAPRAAVPDQYPIAA